MTDVRVQWMLKVFLAKRHGCVQSDVDISFVDGVFEYTVPKEREFVTLKIGEKNVRLTMSTHRAPGDGSMMCEMDNCVEGTQEHLNSCTCGSMACDYCFDKGQCEDCQRKRQ